MVQRIKTQEVLTEFFGEFLGTAIMMVCIVETKLFFQNSSNFLLQKTVIRTNGSCIKLFLDHKFTLCRSNCFWFWSHLCDAFLCSHFRYRKKHFLIFKLTKKSSYLGAHLNPVFSIALCMLGKLPVWKLAHYFLAQIVGSIFGSSIVYILYFQSIEAYEQKGTAILNSTQLSLGSLKEETASIFITKPAVHVTLPVAMFDQIFITFLIVFAVLFIIDERILKTPFALQALIIGGTIVSIGAGTGYNCSAILNPGKFLTFILLLIFLK